VITVNLSELRLWVGAMRLHQWLKNLLILVPLLVSHRVDTPGFLARGIIAFFLFGLCASSAYLLNDLLDVTSDRQHPTKRRRPLAAGLMSFSAAAIAIPMLLSCSFVGALLTLPWRFTVAMAAYFATTVMYSIWLKRLMIVDVVTLAMLYTLRIIAGTLLFQLVMTFWMLAFSMFIFLSLALVKRYAELIGAHKKGDADRPGGRGYYPGDLSMIASLGAASGYLSVMVLALYIQDPNTAALYKNPRIIWLACPILLYWISRVWVLTHRGDMNDDPVVFAISDRASLVVGALFGLVFWLAV
jgi:4-hydroxybenzoate polyprenyltransferase